MTPNTKSTECLKESIEPFVRDTLGCNCPSEVFEQIDIDTASTQFDGLPHDGLIEIGGRLLVLIVRVDDGSSLQDALADYIDRGRRYRDENGFNRFRMVVACDNAGDVSPLLSQRFSDLAGMDDRLHLHVLSQDVVPQL
jgi:hypothetical protein